MSDSSSYLRCAAYLALGASAACEIKLPFVHPSLTPYLKYQQQPSNGTVTVTFLGTSSLLFRNGNAAILSDPFITRPRGSTLAHPIAPNVSPIKRTLAQLGVRQIDAIFTSHSHYDHAMDAPTFAKQMDAVLLGSSSTEKLGIGGELPSTRIEVVRDGDTRRYGDFELTFIESQHGVPEPFAGDILALLTPPAGVSEWKSGKTWSVLIRHGKRSMLVHPSANVKHDALKGRYADVVYLGVGGLDKRSEEFAEDYWTEVVRATRARRVILIHWDDFFRSLDEPLGPMAYATDSFPDTMRHLLRYAEKDRVEVLLPVAWQTADPFADLN